MVLLVIDAQKQITNGKLYGFDMFVSNVRRLISAARANGVEVIYIRHDDGRESELTRGKEGFEIYEAFEPAPGEKIFDKTVNSAFHGTGLLEYLKEKQETDLMITGLQTDYCIDATVKCAFEHGFFVFVPAHANTTTDNSFMTGESSYRYYNEFMWNGRYAECITMEQGIGLMENRPVL